MKFFSIIIPTYNSSATIKNCIEILQQQTFTDFEILIIDGLSTDNTKIIIEEIDDDRIFFCSGEDAGVYDAMNKGIKIANAKWLFFLGSDDFLYNENVLADTSEILNKTSSKFVYGDVKIVGDSIWARDNEIYRGKTSVTDLLSVNICHQCIFYASEIFESKLYNLKYNVLADYDFNIYCCSKYEMRYIPIIVSYFNSGGISSNVKDAVFEIEKWLNIIKYFGLKLLNKAFYRYRYNIKKTIIPFTKEYEFKLAFISIIVFCYLKLIRFKV